MVMRYWNPKQPDTEKEKPDKKRACEALGDDVARCQTDILGVLYLALPVCLCGGLPFGMLQRW